MNRIEQFIASIEHLPPDLVEAVKDYAAEASEHETDQLTILLALREAIISELQARGDLPPD